MPAPDYDGPEEGRELIERMRALAETQDARAADPEIDDWQSPLTVRRPRIRAL